MFSVNKSSFDYFLSRETNKSVIITSPGYPYGYSKNLHVSWTLHTDQYHHVEVKFLDVDLNHIYSIFEKFNDFVKVETG